MEAVLIWQVGGGGNSLGQNVEYKLWNQSIWTVAANLGPNVTTYTIHGLPNNQIFDFRVVNICADGGPTASQLKSQIEIICPVLTVSVFSGAIGFNFMHLGGDVSKYTVDLLDANQAFMSQKIFDAPVGSISGTFDNLAPSTNYHLRVTVYAGPTYAYVKQCPNVLATTAAPQTCNVPLNLVVTVSSAS